jgi:hypothetical protein
MDNPYIRLTQEFNHGRFRAILASGQAVVLYRLALRHGLTVVHVDRDYPALARIAPLSQRPLRASA